MKIISDEITGNGTYIIRNINFEHGYTITVLINNFSKIWEISVSHTNTTKCIPMKTFHNRLLYMSDDMNNLEDMLKKLKKEVKQL